MERWGCHHQTCGNIEVILGTFEELKQVDPDFPDQPGTGSAEGSEYGTEEGKRWRLARMAEDHPYLVRVNGVVIARQRKLQSIKISLNVPSSEDKPPSEPDPPGVPEPFQELKEESQDAQARDAQVQEVSEQCSQTEDKQRPATLLNRMTKQMEPSDDLGFHANVSVLKPYVRLEPGGFLRAWLRTATIYTSQSIMEMDPPVGSRGAQRAQEIETNPFKRWFYPLAAGVGKSGWALFTLLVLPLIGKILQPVFDFLWSLIKPIFDWIAQFIPDIHIPWPHITWPDIHIPWPDIHIPWPEWHLPHWRLPWIVQFVAQYPKVWMPIIVGIAVGVASVRAGKSTRKAKLTLKRQEFVALLRARLEYLQTQQAAENNPPGITMPAFSQGDVIAENDNMKDGVLLESSLKELDVRSEVEDENRHAR